MSVRINNLDTPYWYHDVIDLLEQSGARLDQIMSPKVGCAADVDAIDALVTAVEAATIRSAPINFEVITESATGIAHVEEITASSPRLQAMSLGAAYFAASMGMATTGIVGTQAHYYMLHAGVKHWTDPWHWAQALRSATLGMVRKWATPPKQIALYNKIFTPCEAALAEARKILAIMAKANGEGATVYKQRLLYIASIKQPEVIVRQAEMIQNAPAGD